MTRKKQVGRYVHCLKDRVELTSDHMFPKAWYPDATTENLEKWQFPACVECNNRHSKIERETLDGLWAKRRSAGSILSVDLPSYFVAHCIKLDRLP